ncbi:hypothetical protein [Campylobacter geochelonis]|uniref:hypothetical protein n=1 Tax=Campylobacter geochelonis TaxID=1780362 RepID=UPI0007708C71|nr:hypothetical protein [Campylobacter geochelonis]CZE46633.1 Uncharacterised protein [Campylobacter geochelonis]
MNKNDGASYLFQRSDSLKHSKQFISAAIFFFILLFLCAFMEEFAKNLDAQLIKYGKIATQILPFFIFFMIYKAGKFISYHARDDAMLRANQSYFTFSILSLFIYLVMVFLPEFISVSDDINLIFLGSIFLFELIAFICAFRFNAKLSRFSGHNIFIITFVFLAIYWLMIALYAIFFVYFALFQPFLPKIALPISSEDFMLVLGGICVLLFVMIIAYFISWLRINDGKKELSNKNSVQSKNAQLFPNKKPVVKETENVIKKPVLNLNTNLDKSTSLNLKTNPTMPNQTISKALNFDKKEIKKPKVKKSINLTNFTSKFGNFFSKNSATSFDASKYPKALLQSKSCIKKVLICFALIFVIALAAGFLNDNALKIILVLTMVFIGIIAIYLSYQASKFISYHAQDEDMYRFNKNYYMFLVLSAVLIIATHPATKLSPLLGLFLAIFSLVCGVSAFVYYIRFNWELSEFTKNKIFIIFAVIFAITSTLSDIAKMLAIASLISTTNLLWLVVIASGVYYIISWLKISEIKVDEKEVKTLFGK